MSRTGAKRERTAKATRPWRGRRGVGTWEATSLGHRGGRPAKQGKVGGGVWEERRRKGVLHLCIWGCSDKARATRWTPFHDLAPHSREAVPQRCFSPVTFCQAGAALNQAPGKRVRWLSKREMTVRSEGPDGGKGTEEVQELWQRRTLRQVT